MKHGTKRAADDRHHDDVLATLYWQFDNLAVYPQDKIIVPYRPNLRQWKLANMEVANTASPQPLTLNTIDDIDVSFNINLSEWAFQETNCRR